MQSKSRKPILIIVCLLFGIITVAPVIMVAGPYLTNNSRASDLEDTLCEIDYGDLQVELIDSQNVCGKVTGNGNDMDYFAAVLLKVENASLEEIDACLAALREEYSIVGVQTQTAPELENKYLEHDGITFDASFEEGGTYAVVYALYSDNSFWATLDIRAH